MFHIYKCGESISAIFNLLFPLHLFSPSNEYPPLNMTCFTFLSALEWWRADRILFTVSHKPWVGTWERTHRNGREVPYVVTDTGG
jgi:hypothetical protein